MQSFKGRFEPTRFEDLTVTVDFHCHSACRFCIVQEGMNLFRGVSLERFKRAIDDNGKKPRYRRLTLTGGEITLEKVLFDYVDYAKANGGFEHIRLQTNGRLLADRDYAQRLVDHGVDEFFVSLHGPDPETQDYISQRKGSFDEAWRGLVNLREMGVVLMTNTVLTTLNFKVLRDIVERVSEVAPARMEFWNYLPMEDYADERNLLAPMAELGPALRDALGRARELGISCAVKYVPRCVLGEFGDTQDNAQPDVVIVEGFYDVYPRFACLWEAKCEHAESCLGLTHPYIAKHGWEQDLLVPVPRTRPWQEPEDGLALPTDTPVGSASPPPHHPAWLALIDGAPEQAGVKLAELLLDRRRCTFRLQTPAGSSVDLMLTKRSEGRPALARSRSFNLSYRSLQMSAEADEEGERKLLTSALRIAIEAITEHDDGALVLDERKGLVGAEAFRRPREEGSARLTDAEKYLRDGYVVLHDLYDAATMATMRDALDELRSRIGNPKMFARDPIRDVPNTEISGTGLVFYELLGWCPELANLLFRPRGVEVVRQILGDDARLELVGAVMTDHTRPFFEWHNHVGGPDDEAVRRGLVPAPPRSRRPERLSYLIYLDDVTPTDGPMLILPGRPADPSSAPEPRDRQRWQGDVAETWRAGSVLLIDETTWHAVPQRTTPGMRRWVGTYFAAGHVGAAERVDASLASVTEPLVRAFLP